MHQLLTLVCLSFIACHGFALGEVQEVIQVTVKSATREHSLTFPKNVGLQELEESAREVCTLVQGDGGCVGNLVGFVRDKSAGRERNHYWFEMTGGLNLFERYLRPLAERAKADAKPLTALEVGSFEGASAAWIAENMLSHPESQLLCVDAWDSSSYLQDDKRAIDFDIHLQLFIQNMRATSNGERVRVLRGDSLLVLSSLIVERRGEAFLDVAYIDGSHRAADVMADALLAFRMVSVGGLMIFDDYMFEWGSEPSNDTPKIAIDSFILAMGTDLEVLEVGYMLVARKVGSRYASESLTNIDVFDVPRVVGIEYKI